MAEKFRFFDPVQLEDGTYDREYNAQEFTDYFRALVTTGVMKSVGNQLAVSANGNNMITRIDNGIAFILGRYYENDGLKELTHDTESLGNSRIDRVVIRMDLSPDKRHVLAFIKKGTPSKNPVPPTLTQTTNIYEISLAQVRVVGGQTFIATNAVVSERGIDAVCPWAGSNILPSFDDNALAQHIRSEELHVQSGERDKWNTVVNKASFIAANGEALNPDTTLEQFFISNHTSLGGGWWYVENKWFSYSGKGAPQMQVAYRYLGDTSTMKVRHSYNSVWSPWSPDLQSLFQSVSSGKQAIASATTDMGIATSANAEFATMAANIRAIQTGRKEARGSATLVNVAGQGRVVVWGLNFVPSIILVARNNGGNAWQNHAIYVKTDAFSPASSGIDVYTYTNSNGIRTTEGGAIVALGTGFEIRITGNYTSNGAAGTYSWIALG